MTLSEHEVGSHGATSERPQTELALRSSRETLSSLLPEVTASNSASIATPRKSLSRSESRLPLTSLEPSSVGSRGSNSFISAYDSNERHKKIIVRSFAPRVAVFASPDTEDFVKAKGFRDGLHSLLRPYGERLHGRVVIRNSVGGSRGWDDYGIRFMDSKALQEASAHYAGGNLAGQDARKSANGSQRISELTGASYSDKTGTSIDRVLDSYLRTTGAALETYEKGCYDFEGMQYRPRLGHSPAYLGYLRKLLSSASIVPYETFSHPVACLIAVSSRHPAPIEALRQLYLDTGHGGKKVPVWMGTEFLRYYVLIHDEETDDITKSTALFDLMKRHFGLHCHLLRLRRSQCVFSDDDSVVVPSCEWLSAEGETKELCMNDNADELDLPGTHIFESDSAAIKSFLREMVTQSIVPFMESRVVTWNDQVASRRRGISGRFMSLSKRWTAFGSAKSTTPSFANVSSPSGTNYNHQQGFYPPETPESTMRLLGDYAFMLRDWKLAHSTYDVLRVDFGHDKAWAYHAAANEMAAITSLLIPHASNPSSRSESLDQMLETAAYSYLTRCTMPFNAIRCLTIAIELLKTRGPSGAADAARWGVKMLELGVLAPSAQALTTECIADSHMSQPNLHSAAAGTFKRQAALWSLLASDAWRGLDISDEARACLREAGALYALDDQDSAELPFPSMQGLWQTVRDAARGGYASLIETSVAQEKIGSTTNGKVEQVNAFTRSRIGSQPDMEGFTAQEAGRIDPAKLDNPPLEHNAFE